MIKSKISARVKSLECAIDYYRNCPSATTRDVKSAADEFYDFVVGHIDLPNVEPANDNNPEINTLDIW